MMYNYKAELLKVVDGDTVDMNVDMGFNVRIKQRMRLYGIDTAELRDKDEDKRKKALKAKDYVCELLKLNQSYEIETYKEDKYGRLLVKIYLNEEETLNEMLLKIGLAEFYMKRENK